MLSLQEKILDSVQEAIQASCQLKNNDSLQFIEAAATMITNTFLQGNKIILAGNGGSLCDAQHFAEELTGFFRQFRKPYPAIALADSGHITCVSNDFGFDYIFSRGVEAFGKPGDIFIGLTTSGNSQNIINAFTTAKKNGLQTIAFLGKGGGKLKNIADIELIINNFTNSDRIQEAHMAAIHIIIEMIELLLSKDECNVENLNLCHSP